MTGEDGRGPRARCRGGATLTLQEAADRLGVHYMTAYRYLRTGRLNASWRDGRWWVPAGELEALAEELARRPAPGRRPGSVRGRTDQPPAGRPVDPSVAERLAGRLVAGDEAGAWVVLEALVLAGHDVVDVVTDVLGPAMRAIGERWATGEVSIAEEHLASQVVERLVVRLGTRSRRPGRRSPVVALAAPPGELHRLPLSMAVHVLRAAGFSVLDLGCDLPAADLVATVQDPPRPLAGVVVGATLPAHRPALAEVVRALKTAVPGVRVLVGGAAVPSAAEAEALGADGWTGPDARSLVRAVDAVVRGSRPRALPSG
ncbi:B12-binding domain-containing protein [Aciditerrimonas ferrireducens]|uniref:B12-binding domain-containing protein n=1 Tax=Aciditerrimonas ferrireducens TaxID=667306 RepID=A0ABV6C0K7_9ACTN